jgi:hypothetical protein
MDDRILKLAIQLKNDGDGVIQDYESDVVEYDFALGVVIAYNLAIEHIEEIWDIDLRDYYINESFQKSKF